MAFESGRDNHDHYMEEICYSNISFLNKQRDCQEFENLKNEKYPS